MSQPAAYTPLESLLLFQSLLAQGVDGPAFARVSEILKNHPLIRAESTYNPARLSADALQQLFLVLWQEELKTETERAINNDATLSPSSRKRKLESPPLPTLSDTYEHINKLPGLVDRLYTRYRSHIVKELRDEEQRFARVKREVTLLERNERQRLAGLAEQQKAASASPTVAPNARSAGTAHTPTPIAVAPKRPTSTTPVFPPKPPTNIAPAASTPSNLPLGAHIHRPSHSPQPPSSASSVLQPPAGAQQGTPQSLQAQPPHVPRPSISPRPDAAGRGQPGAVASPSPYPKPVPTPAGQAQQYHPQQPPRLQPSPTPHQAQAQARPPPKTTPGQPSQSAQTVPLQAAPPRPTGAPPLNQQPRPTSNTPVHPPTRPIQPQTQVNLPRPIASASPTPPPSAAVAVPPPKWPQNAQQPSSQQPVAGSTPTTVTPKPSVTQAPRPAIPEHMIRHAATPNSARRTSSGPPVATTPTTPVVQSPSSSVTRGFGTKWAPQSTPSTPGPLAVEPESPAFEPVSPPARGAIMPPREPMKLTLPADIAGKVNKARASRLSAKGNAVPNVRTRRSVSVASHTDDMSVEHSEQDRPIKDEDATPRPRDETGDTTADESVQGRRHSVRTPSSVSSRVPKRKRQETPPGPPTKQTHVMWTRGFTKVSSSVLDRISSHRDANMFANPLRERDAPNYRGIVLQPQDFTSIRAAIKNGNKAAVSAAGNLAGGDPGTPNVWLPISEDLVPPRAIINSAQLERELVHMFCNAIMYNPDPNRGPGPHFLRRSDDEDEEIVGYQLDEDGVVRNTRNMFLEVEKLLGDLRSAEKDRNNTGPPPHTTRPGSSVAATPAGDDTADDEDELAADTDPPSASGTIKRRRLGVRG